MTFKCLPWYTNPQEKLQLIEPQSCLTIKKKKKTLKTE